MPTSSGYFKMAASKLSQGHKCEFIDSVPDYLCCKKCTLVARKLSIISCCGESFCQSCIADTQKEGKPCPACGEKNFTTLEQIKSQKQIASLRVYCSMKERGCNWSGTLEHLGTHLDPDKDNCQYVYTKCPLNCHMTIPKNKVEQHVAQHCAKRPYVCQHCNFKATYDEVMDTHLPECKYVPLQCPNLCGVTFERDFMEDHMKMCRLEEVGCEFSGVGCDGRFRREDQEEHTKQNSQKHLTLTASLAMETKEQLQQKLLEQDKKHKEEEEKHLTLTASLAVETKEHLQQKLLEQHKEVKEQTRILETKLLNQEQKHKVEEQKLKQQLEKQVKKLENKDREHEEEWKKLKQIIEEQRKDMQELRQMLVLQEHKLDKETQRLLKEEQKLKMELQNQCKEYEAEKEKNLKKFEEQIKKLEQHQISHEKTSLKVQKLESNSEQARQNEAKFSPALSLGRTFVMKDFAREKEMRNKWKSPDMYTHIGGYKFSIGVDAMGRQMGFEGHLRGCEGYIGVYVCARPGLYDRELKWPIKATITLELINQQGGENAACTTSNTWNRPTQDYVQLDKRFERIKIEHALWKYSARMEVGHDLAFLNSSEVEKYLLNDTLHFNISHLELF